MDFHKIISLGWNLLFYSRLHRGYRFSLLLVPDMVQSFNCEEAIRIEVYFMFPGRISRLFPYKPLKIGGKQTVSCPISTWPGEFESSPGFRLFRYCEAGQVSHIWTGKWLFLTTKKMRTDWGDAPFPYKCRSRNWEFSDYRSRRWRSDSDSGEIPPSSRFELSPQLAWDKNMGRKT